MLKYVNCTTKVRFLSTFVQFCDETSVAKKNLYPQSMNDFPIIGDLVMRTGLWDRQGANIASRYKEMYGVELFLRLKPVSLDRECRILP